jgi:hypothetical protein
MIVADGPRHSNVSLPLVPEIVAVSPLIETGPFVGGGAACRARSTWYLPIVTPPPPMPTV